jgi:hypothetical protein
LSKAYVKPILTFVPNFRNMFGETPRTDSWYVGLKQGVTVDAFRSKLRDGIYAGSNYQMDALKVNSSTPVGFTHKYLSVQTVDANTHRPLQTTLVTANFNGHLQSLWNHGFSHFATVSSANEAEALSRLYSRIKAEYEHMNSLNFLGELGETVKMLRSPASALLDNTSRLLSTVKSTRAEVRRRVQPRKSDSAKDLARRRSQAVADAISGTWLEYAFGLVPLMSDVKDIAETAARALVGKDSMTRVSAKSEDTQGSSILYSGDVSVGSTATLCRYYREARTTASCRYVAGLRSHLTGPAQGLNNLARLSGVTLSNIIPTAYQLLPWSFLVDYFVNLGDVLEAWFVDTSNLVYFSKTNRQVTEYLDHEWFRPNPQTQGYFAGSLNTLAFVGRNVSRRSLTRTTLVRSSGQALPIPSLVAKMPGIDSTKWINMAALLQQTRAFRF